MNKKLGIQAISRTRWKINLSLKDLKNIKDKSAFLNMFLLFKNDFFMLELLRWATGICVMLPWAVAGVHLKWARMTASAPCISPLIDTSLSLIGSVGPRRLLCSWSLFCSLLLWFVSSPSLNAGCPRIHLSFYLSVPVTCQVVLFLLSPCFLGAPVLLRLSLFSSLSLIVPFLPPQEIQPFKLPV